MDVLPVLKILFNDELLYGWVLRLIDANGLNISQFTETFLGHDSRRYIIRPDAKNEFLPLMKSVGIKEGMKTLYLDTTTFQFEALAMTRGEQAHYLNNVFRPSDRLNSPVNGLFQSVKICPECVMEEKEKYGMAYIHRSHQLSGVCTCHKHGCRLLEYKGKKNRELDFDMADYEEVKSNASVNSLLAYTDYVQKIFEAEISSDLDTVRKAVHAAMKEKGFSNSSVLVSALRKWEYRDLFVSDIPVAVKSVTGWKNVLKSEDLMAVVMFLFPNVEEFISAVQTDEPLLIEHICPDCGNIYCSTPYADRNGWGCPECENKISETQRFKNIVSAMGDGEYEVLSGLEGLDTEIDLRHKPCGNITKIKPREVLFGNTKCFCDKCSGKETARKKIEAHAGFRLVSYTRFDESVEIYHEGCGNTFTVDSLRQFMASPRCRCCEPYYVDTETLRERVEGSTSGGYTLVGEFNGWKEKTRIRHNLCGTEYECLPSHFLQGTSRCPKCRKEVMSEPWEENFRLMCEYKDEYGHFPVGDESYKGHSLGRWCRKQRSFHNKGTLDTVKEEKLKSVGFDFDPYETEWNRRYEQFKRYVAENGTRYKTKFLFESEDLGSWIAVQKKAFGKEKLTDERKEKLLAVDPNLFS